MSTYDDWKLRSPDDEYPQEEEPEFEPEFLPLEFEDLEFLFPADNDWEG